MIYSAGQPTVRATCWNLQKTCTDVGKICKAHNSSIISSLVSKRKYDNHSQQILKMSYTENLAKESMSCC